ncbi:MAG: FeoA family protein [Brumimicrobium sp.]|nr:FeoA family protein [Brumimicrobium sp.]
MNTEERSLINLRKGQRGVIARIEQSAVSQRLMEMGLVPGTRFEIRSISPFGDPIAIRLKDFAVSLRLSDAKNIFIQER